MIRGRLRRRGGGEGDGDDYVEIDPAELTGALRAPGWLRDAGISAWLTVGVFVFLVGAVWLLSLTQSIVIPVIVAAIVAAVAAPVVAWLRRHHVPRGLGAALILLAIVALGCLVVFLILAGIASETSSIVSHLRDAANQIQGWLEDLGVSSSKADQANADTSAGLSDAFHALIGGIGPAIDQIASLGFFCAMTVLSLFFLLKDGPTIRAWLERRIPVPASAARSITNRTEESLRGYFLGVTIVAAFSAILVGGGALALGVPVPATIAVVTFLAGYVPYIGAWSAGAFSVLIALGGTGEEAAAGMVVIQLLSNGPLQQIVQPIAYGAALGIHPLAVLVVTIAGGALFGAIGLILAAPLTAAAVRVAADLSRARAAEREAGAGSQAPAGA